jgi:hypothetical protein
MIDPIRARVVDAPAGQLLCLATTVFDIRLFNNIDTIVRRYQTGHILVAQ